MDTASPVHDPKLSARSYHTPKKEKVGREEGDGGKEKENARKVNLPAERNTICIVGGTLNAKTRLFSSVPDAKVVTWSSHCAMGTWRGLSRGSQARRRDDDDDSDDPSHIKKDGSC